jgi:RND family efflux transporter MFP subunit
MKLKYILYSLGLIALAIMGSKFLADLKPDPPKAAEEKILTAVEVVVCQPKDHAVKIFSQGPVQPLTETKMASEVAGKITAVSPQFHVGGSFQLGEVLLEIEAADYEAAVAQSEATLADARLQLATEEARRDQAERDWARLSPGEKPSALVKREPHVASALARVKASEAALQRARRDLERTKIRAPYPGYVKTKRADLGDYVGPSTPLADLWRSDVFEIRLPVTLDELSLIAVDQRPAVTLTTETRGTSRTWSATIERTEGVIDTTMRSTHLVARLEQPQPAPEPGLFVKGLITGQTLKKVIAVPRKSLVGPKRALIVTAQDTLTFRDLEPIWSDQESLYIDKGINAGERLCLTSLAAPTEGMPVRVVMTSAAPL